MWTSKESSRHINYLEILAAFFALKVFRKSHYDCQILLRINNTTAVSYLNRIGRVQLPYLTSVTRQLWQFFASYICSADNVIADAESRRIHPDIEWELSNQFGLPDLDLFACRINKKCKKYVFVAQRPRCTFEVFTH